MTKRDRTDSRSITGTTKITPEETAGIPIPPRTRTLRTIIMPLTPLERGIPRKQMVTAT
jgi:hypothetical protein